MRDFVLDSMGKFKRKVALFLYVGRGDGPGDGVQNEVYSQFYRTYEEMAQ